MSENCQKFIFLNNLFELTQIKSHNRIKVLLQGSVAAGFDASLDTAPSSLSGLVLQLQICSCSRSHPPGTTSSQLSPSWASPFPNLISTDYLLLQYSRGAQTPEAAGSQRRSSWSLPRHLWYCRVCWPPPTAPLLGGRDPPPAVLSHANLQGKQNR